MRRAILLVAATSLVLVMGVPMATSAGASGALKFHEHITCSEADCWVGTVSGDITGAVRFGGDPAHESWGSGTAWHFYEVFTIEPESGGWIEGTDAGVYIMANGMYAANGWVTDASPEWEYLIGYKFHESGFTTDPNTLPVIGDAHAFIAPA